MHEICGNCIVIRWPTSPMRCRIPDGFPGNPIQSSSGASEIRPRGRHGTPWSARRPGAAPPVQSGGTSARNTPESPRPRTPGNECTYELTNDRLMPAAHWVWPITKQTMVRGQSPTRGARTECRPEGRVRVCHRTVGLPQTSLRRQTICTKVIPITTISPNPGSSRLRSRARPEADRGTSPVGRQGKATMRERYTSYSTHICQNNISPSM